MRMAIGMRHSATSMASTLVDPILFIQCMLLNIGQTHTRPCDSHRLIGARAPKQHQGMARSLLRKLGDTVDERN